MFCLFTYIVPVTYYPVIYYYLTKRYIYSFIFYFTKLTMNKCYNSLWIISCISFYARFETFLNFFKIYLGGNPKESKYIIEYLLFYRYLRNYYSRQ